MKYHKTHGPPKCNQIFSGGFMTYFRQDNSRPNTLTIQDVSPPHPQGISASTSINLSHTSSPPPSPAITNNPPAPSHRVSFAHIPDIINDSWSAETGQSLSVSSPTVITVSPGAPPPYSVALEQSTPVPSSRVSCSSSPTELNAHSPSVSNQLVPDTTIVQPLSHQAPPSYAEAMELPLLNVMSLTTLDAVGNTLLNVPVSDIPQNPPLQDTTDTTSPLPSVPPDHTNTPGVSTSSHIETVAEVTTETKTKVCFLHLLVV